jgi:ribonuclease HI
MYFDGSLMKSGAGAGSLFISPLGKLVRYVIRLHFRASNNVAEYEALVNGLHIAAELGVRRLDDHGDSQLVIDQVMKNSHCRDRKMEAYWLRMISPTTEFGAWKISSTGWNSTMLLDGTTRLRMSWLK